MTQPSRSRSHAETPPAVAASEPSASGIEMLFWENQVWKPGGGSQRLTLWADGRSEVRVNARGGTPMDAQGRALDRIPKPGWQKTDDGAFVRKDALPKPEAVRLFRAAIDAEIHRIEPFEPEYVDGSGTLVGIQREGKLTEVVIPLFPEEAQGSDNQRRFAAVAKLLSEFDTDAFDTALAL